MKTHIINLLPFNNRTEMSRTEYVIKKVLAFILIFFVAGVLGEAVVIGLYTGMGYDSLHGVMPEGQIAGLIPYYGYILFSVIAILYCKINREAQHAGYRIYEAGNGLSAWDRSCRSNACTCLVPLLGNRLRFLFEN